MTADPAGQVEPEDDGVGTSTGRGSVIMAAGTFVSRALGMIRNVLLVAVVGATGPIANAFDIANKLPNVLYALLATGLINAVLVPQLVKAFRRSNWREYTDKLLTIAGVLMAAAALLFTVGAPLLVRMYTDSSWTNGQLALATALAYWCTPQVFFYGLYAILGQVLNARKQFGPYMWAPALNNVISIAGFAILIWIFGRAVVDGGAGPLASWTSTQTAWLGGIATGGIVAQALILLVPLHRGGFRWRLRFGMRGIGLRAAGTVSMWVILATIVDQVGVWWTTRLATAAPHHAYLAGHTSIDDIASNGTYTQALMIYLLPHSLVTVSITTALFTSMSKAAAAGQLDRVRADLSQGMRMVGVFTIMASAAMVSLAQPLVKALVPSMRAVEVAVTAPVLIAMSLGLVALGAMVLMKWAFFAFEDGRTVFLMQLPGTGALVLFAWLGTVVLPGQWWVMGIGLAMAASNAIVVVARYGGLRRKLHGLDEARVIRLYVRAAIAAGVAMGPAWLTAHLIGYAPGGGWFHAIASAGGGAVVLVAIYFGLLRAMRVDEVNQLFAPILRKIRR
ncbi:murein biosynthesis integral membrane protein MurJ [Rarobacter incanus]|uniref:Putative peptidoglycan lipid II flippase n=1 Tax=Rarobacter incanus TaxID=153494 RepID=A0A542SPZ4_9MICO|nr:lipid II flippase MurJ [Rarobacter incanus]TQK76693.1 putative peptidoglycan lipid II flippase [Rarobacter incanus]